MANDTIETIVIDETTTIDIDTFFALQDAIAAGKNPIELINVVRDGERAAGRDATINKALGFVRAATGK